MLPLVLMVYSGVLTGKVAAFGHGIAMDSVHGVFLLRAAFVLRRALFSSVILCIDVRCSDALLRALISFFCSAVKLFRLTLSLALLRALISSFCSVVKLFRLVLSRSRLAWFLSSEMFDICCLCSAISNQDYSSWNNRQLIDLVNNTAQRFGFPINQIVSWTDDIRTILWTVDALLRIEKIH